MEDTMKKTSPHTVLVGFTVEQAAEHIAQLVKKSPKKTRKKWRGLTLAELRKESGLTQKEIAAKIDWMTQSGVSRFERRDDCLISMLREYIEALGGKLEVVATFGDKTIRLRGV